MTSPAFRHGGRGVYYKKLANLIRPSGSPLLEYADHEGDRFFFNDSGHPSAKAWIYYDEALDRFHRPVRSLIARGGLPSLGGGGSLGHGG